MVAIVGYFWLVRSNQSKLLFVMDYYEISFNDDLYVSILYCLYLGLSAIFLGGGEGDQIRPNLSLVFAGL